MQNKKICKFYLFKKCKFGEDCKFYHVNLNDINQILVELKSLKAENDLLKKEIQQKNKKIENLKINKSDVTSNEVHACKKRLFSSFFKKNESNSLSEKSKEKDNKTKNSYSNDSGIEDDIDRIHRVQYKQTSKHTNKSKECFDKSVNCHKMKQLIDGAIYYRCGQEYQHKDYASEALTCYMCKYNGDAKQSAINHENCSNWKEKIENILNELEKKCFDNENNIIALDIRLTKNEKTVESIKSDYESFEPSLEKIDKIFELVQNMYSKENTK